MNAAEVSCQQCSTLMERTEIVEQNRALQAVALLLVILGIVLLAWFPIGTIVGILVIIGVWRMGYSKKPVWRCPNCSYYFARAE